MSGLYLNGHSDQFVQARPPKPKRKKNKTMDTATAKSITLPVIIKSLNSFNITLVIG